MKFLLFSVILTSLGAAYLVASCSGDEYEPVSHRMRLHPSLAHGFRLFDILLAEPGDGAHDIQLVKRVREMLNETEVDHPDKAYEVAWQANGLLVHETKGWHTVDLFRLSEGIDSFAEPGDLIWRLQLLNSGVDGSIGGISGEIWVNANTKGTYNLFTRKITTPSADESAERSRKDFRSQAFCLG